MYAGVHLGRSGRLTIYTLGLVAVWTRRATTYRLVAFAMQHAGIGVQRSPVEYYN